MANSKIKSINDSKVKRNSDQQIKVIAIGSTDSVRIEQFKGGILLNNLRKEIAEHDYYLMEDLYSCGVPDMSLEEIENVGISDEVKLTKILAAGESYMRILPISK